MGSTGIWRRLTSARGVPLRVEVTCPAMRRLSAPEIAPARNHGSRTCGSTRTTQTPRPGTAPTCWAVATRATLLRPAAMRTSPAWTLAGSPTRGSRGTASEGGLPLRMSWLVTSSSKCPVPGLPDPGRACGAGRWIWRCRPEQGAGDGWASGRLRRQAGRWQGRYLTLLAALRCWNQTGRPTMPARPSGGPP
jgi:hypothetical protein